MRSSRLPALKTLEEYDFAFQPSVKREQIVSLHELGFVARKENVVFLGPPGVGKDAPGDQPGRRGGAGRKTDLLRHAVRPGGVSGRSPGGRTPQTSGSGR